MISTLEMSIPFIKLFVQKLSRKKEDCINSETYLTFNLSHAPRLSKHYLFLLYHHRYEAKGK